MKRTSLVLLILSVLPILLTAQEKPKDKGLRAITASSIQGPLEFLASDWMTGRETGTKGEFMASDYIASVYRSIGLKPGGSSNNFTPGYFQNISFILFFCRFFYGRGKVGKLDKVGKLRGVMVVCTFY